MPAIKNNQESKEKQVPKGLNLFNEFTLAQRETIFITNARTLSLGTINDLFIGTYRGLHAHDAAGKIIYPNYEKNAKVLLTMYNKGWDFRTLIGLLERVNHHAINLESNLIDIKSVDYSVG
jgi:hypothetical protein